MRKPYTIKISMILLIFITLFFLSFTGCIENPSKESQQKDIEYANNIIITGETNIINISHLTIETIARNYVDDENPDIRLKLKIVDGFQPTLDYDLDVYYHVRGKATLLTGERVENILITAIFTDANQTNFNTQVSRMIPALTSTYSSFFEIRLYNTDTVFFDQIDSITLDISISK